MNEVLFQEMSLYRPAQKQIVQRMKVISQMLSGNRFYQKMLAAEK